MNLRHLCNRVVSSLVVICCGGSLVEVSAHSVSAQSITVTTPFSYCVNSRAYPGGQYKFTLVSDWLLSIRNVNGGGEDLFLVHPEAGGAKGMTIGSVGPAGGLTFRTFQGFKELQAVHEPGPDLILELIGPATARDKSKTHGSLQPINCFTEGSSAQGRNTTGQ